MYSPTRSNNFRYVCHYHLGKMYVFVNLVASFLPSFSFFANISSFVRGEIFEILWPTTMVFAHPVASS